MPSSAPGHYHLRRAQLVITVAVGRVNHLDHGARRRAGGGYGGHRVVAGRIETCPQVVPAGLPAPGQQVHRLIPDRADALDDGARVGAGVLERPVEVVEHGQPVAGNLGPLPVP